MHSQALWTSLWHFTTCYSNNRGNLKKPIKTIGKKRGIKCGTGEGALFKSRLASFWRPHLEYTWTLASEGCRRSKQTVIAANCLWRVISAVTMKPRLMVLGWQIIVDRVCRFEKGFFFIVIKFQLFSVIHIFYIAYRILYSDDCRVRQ